MDSSSVGVICSNYSELCENNGSALLTTAVFLLNETIPFGDIDCIGTDNADDIDIRCDSSCMSTFNCTEHEYLVSKLGESVGNVWFIVPVTFAYALILLAGIVGNATVCLIIVQNQSMHTNTNYYLFNLAIADLLYLLFGLPFEMEMFWHLYPWPFGIVFCKFRSLITESCSYASVLTIVAFSVERYIAICHPLYSYIMANLKRVIFVIASIWCVSLASASPVAYYRHIAFIRYPTDHYDGGYDIPDSGVCTIQNTFQGLYELSTLVYFIIPLLILIIMYARIAVKLNECIRRRVNGRFGKCSIDTSSKQLKSRTNIIRMLIAIVITFFICWAPFHAQRLLFVYGQSWYNYSIINEVLFTIAGCFYYLSCAINPIIYNVMSHRYRIAFRKTFCCGSKTNTKPKFKKTNT